MSVFVLTYGRAWKNIRFSHLRSGVYLKHTENARILVVGNDGLSKIKNFVSTLSSPVHTVHH